MKNLGMTMGDEAEGRSTGITIEPDSRPGRTIYLAMTMTESKRFKVRTCAIRWMARRGYNPDGTRIPTKASPLPVGARVKIQPHGDEAIVRQAFPEGSTSYLFPHYKVDIIGGDKNCAVAFDKVFV